MTLKEAKSLRYGDIVYHEWRTNNRGLPIACRVVSIKTWKRNPDRIKVGLKYGMYEHCYMENADLSNWVLTLKETFHEHPLTCEGHLEIKVEDPISFNDGWSCSIKLCIKIQNTKGFGLIDEFSVLVGNDPKDFACIPMYCRPSINKGIIRMKRKVHKLFGKQVWIPLPNGKGIRTNEN